MMDDSENPSTALAEAIRKQLAALLVGDTAAFEQNLVTIMEVAHRGRELLSAVKVMPQALPRSSQGGLVSFGPTPTPFFTNANVAASYNPEQFGATSIRQLIQLLPDALSKVTRAKERIARDLDLDTVVHFHDWSVPPEEEEVLAAMLILGSRFEGWLRNEATMLGALDRSDILKNPFGGGGDGVIDSVWTSAVGMMVDGLLAKP